MDRIIPEIIMAEMVEEQPPKKSYKFADLVAKYLDLKKFCFLYLMLFIVIAMLIFDKFDPKVKDEAFGLALNIANYTFVMFQEKQNISLKKD
jgi:hypothetical protein